MFPLLEIKNLQIDFVTEGTISTALHGISFKVNRGEIVGIAGESGSGKSATSLAIMQLLASPPARFSKGDILFSPDGIRQFNMIGLDDQTLQSLRGSQIAMIFQEPMTSLNPVFTCGYQVMEAIRLHEGISIEKARKKTIALFEKVKLPDPSRLFHRYPHQLSGGQKQRVMIAMAICGNPSLLICDEPTTALDVTVQKNVLELLAELQSDMDMGIIFITHNLGVIAEIAHRVIILYKGAIAEEGTVESVFSSPAHPYTKGLLACRPSLYSKGERLPVISDFLSTDSERENNKKNINDTAIPDINHAANQKQARGSQSSYSALQPDAPVLLNAVNLEVWFPAKKSLTGRPLNFIKAVDKVTFSVYAGETLGLVGESGCGKTTLGRALLRLIKPTGGEILYRGKNLASYSGTELKRFRKNIQIIFQDPYSSLNPSMTIGSAIEEPLKVHGLYPRAKQRKEKVIELLEKVNLQADYYYRYPHEFSGGQRQRIVIARALAPEPDFIVCDESVSALDVSVQAQVLNLLNDLKKEYGFTSIFISHDLSVVRYVSDRIMVMNQGKIEEIGSAEQIYNAPRTTYTRKLLAAIPGISIPVKNKLG